MSDFDDSSIPLLAEVVVAGNPGRARSAASLPDETPFAPSAAAQHMARPMALTASAEAREAYDADALVERLRGRCLTYLAGDGRSVIEARCRAALQEHSNWLVGHITREIGLALETELTGWVRAAVREELAARSPRPGDAPH